MEYSLDRLDSFEVFVDTHNQFSCQVVVNKMKAQNLRNNYDRIWFGQLYGMSEHISYKLANNAYNTSKYIPFGSLREVIRYLFRRTEENTSMVAQTSRKLSLIIEQSKEERNMMLRVRVFQC